MNTWASLTARLFIVGLWLAFGCLANTYELFGRPAKGCHHQIGWPLHCFDKGWRCPGSMTSHIYPSSRWAFVQDNSAQFPNHLHQLPLAYNVTFFAVSSVMVWRCFNRRYGLLTLMCLCVISASFLMVERYSQSRFQLRLLFSTVGLLGLYCCQLSLPPRSKAAAPEFDFAADPLAV